MESDELASHPKRARTDVHMCAICHTDSPVKELSKPKDVSSWKTLLRAAELHGIESICQYATCTSIPDIYYHRECRSNITQKNDK